MLFVQYSVLYVRYVLTRQYLSHVLSYNLKRSSQSTTLEMTYVSLTSVSEDVLGSNTRNVPLYPVGRVNAKDADHMLYHYL